MRLKKILSITLALLMIIGLMSGCKNEEDVEPTIVNDGVLATYTANVYLVDSWKEENEDGARKYQTTLLLYSKDYYDVPGVEDIKYQTNEGYEILVDAIEGSSVVLYPMNEGAKSGIATYAKITTNNLIDVKKIYAVLEGPVEYDEEALTEEDYKSKHGKLDDGWKSLMVSISEKLPPRDEVVKMNARVGAGEIMLFHETYPEYFYSCVTGEPTVEGSKIVNRMLVAAMTSDANIEMFVEHVSQYCEYVNFVDGEPTKVELNENLKTVCEIVENEVWFGFETADGSDIENYIDEVPDALAYVYGEAYYFVLK